MSAPSPDDKLLLLAMAAKLESTGLVIDEDRAQWIRDWVNLTSDQFTLDATMYWARRYLWAAGLTLESDP